MGVNIKDVRKIVHFGLPKDIEDYIQAIGRGGRDGGDAHAILYYSGN